MSPQRDAGGTSWPALLLGALLVLPAVVFLGAAAARGVTGPPIQALLTPIIDIVTRAPRWVFLVSLLAMPAAAFGVGALALLHAWSADPWLSGDAHAAAILIRRRLVPLLLLGTTLVAGLSLAIVLGHMLTD